MFQKGPDPSIHQGNEPNLPNVTADYDGQWPSPGRRPGLRS
jgi:hypothetical protein